MKVLFTTIMSQSISLPLIESNMGTSNFVQHEIQMSSNMCLIIFINLDITLYF